jgi:hypothetical protein
MSLGPVELIVIDFPGKLKLGETGWLDGSPVHQAVNRLQVRIMVAEPTVGRHQTKLAACLSTSPRASNSLAAQPYIGQYIHLGGRSI